MVMSMATSTQTETLAGGVASQTRSPKERSFVHAAAARRNAAGGGRMRRQRWRPARDALWALLDQHLAVGARVAVVGAGNGDDLPLRQLSRRAAHLDLIDLDAAALRRARRRVPFARNVHAIVEDVTAGAADTIVQRARGEAVTVDLPAPTPIGHGAYDVLIADLVASQLLFPALSDSGLPGSEIDEVLLSTGQALTNSVVARMHAAAPRGLVVHVHDILVWSDGHKQPFPLEAVLALAETDPAAALTLAQQGNMPYGCDPRTASQSIGATVTQTVFWRWPFALGTDYLVNATIAQSPRTTASCLRSSG
jgi:hypothetical protein